MNFDCVIVCKFVSWLCNCAWLCLIVWLFGIHWAKKTACKTVKSLEGKSWIVPFTNHSLFLTQIFNVIMVIRLFTKKEQSTTTMEKVPISKSLKATISTKRTIFVTLPAEMFGGEWFLTGNQGNHQNLYPSMLTNKLWPFFIKMNQKPFFFFWKKKIKMADSKKGHFPALPILDIFSWKFHRSVLGLVGLIDVKPINVAQPMWSWGCLT